MWRYVSLVPASTFGSETAFLISVFLQDFHNLTLLIFWNQTVGNSKLLSAFNFRACKLITPHYKVLSHPQEAYFPTFRRNLAPSVLRIKQSNILSLKFREPLIQRSSANSQKTLRENVNFFSDRSSTLLNYIYLNLKINEFICCSVNTASYRRKLTRQYIHIYLYIHIFILQWFRWRNNDAL